MLCRGYNCFVLLRGKVSLLISLHCRILSYSGDDKTLGSVVLKKERSREPGAKRCRLSRERVPFVEMEMKVS